MNSTIQSTNKNVGQTDEGEKTKNSLGSTHFFN